MSKSTHVSVFSATLPSSPESFLNAVLKTTGGEIGLDFTTYAVLQKGQEESIDEFFIRHTENDSANATFSTFRDAWEYCSKAQKVLSVNVKNQRFTDEVQEEIDKLDQDVKGKVYLDHCHLEFGKNCVFDMLSDEIQLVGEPLVTFTVYGYGIPDDFEEFSDFISQSPKITSIIDIFSSFGLSASVFVDYSF